MPDWKKLIQQRIASLKLDAPQTSGLVDEIAQHLDDYYREQRSGGASHAEAYRNALSELDDMYPLQAELEMSQRAGELEIVPLGDGKPGNFLEDLWRDLRYALRSMRAAPLFVLFVVLTLALGIGANTTVFTIINRLILNPVPVPKSAELLALAAVQSDKSKSGAPLPISYADLKDYESKNEVFRSLAGYTSPWLVTWQAGGSSERMFNEFVTAAYFSTLEIKPVKGRYFSAEEDAPGAHAVAVMNYGTWQSRFGGADDIIGRALRLNNTVVTVIGIAPPHFIGVNSLFGPDLWIPAGTADQLAPVEMRGILTDRSKAVFLGVGRLKPQITLGAAQANVSGIAGALACEYPETNQGRSAAVLGVRDVMFSSASSGSSPVLLGSTVLLVVVGIILLIACSNVANLLLARSAGRQQEIAVRLALGASRQRLIRQLLTESVFLGLLSGVVGLLVGYAALHLLWSALPSTANFSSPKFDSTVFIFAFVISLATGFLFGVIPAFQASRGNVADVLKEEARSTGRSRAKITLANALLVGQIAFSFLLLITAALFLRSIARAYDIDPGFQTRHLAIFMTNAGQIGYREAQTRAFYKEARARVAALPGVESVSWSSNLPLWARSVSRLQIEGRQATSKSDQITTISNIVDRNYFETAGIAILRGREFTNLDQANSAPIAIVNETLARDFWPSGDALGKRIQLPDERGMRQIVGVAKTATYTNLGEPPQLCVYVPSEQKYSDAMTLYVRTAGDPRHILMSVQREVLAAGPKIVVSDMRTGRQLIDNGLFQAKMGVLLLSAFGLVALGLASVGLYGIMAYTVSQRRREIGLRMALGAGQANVLRLILKQGMALVVTGMLIGLAGALLVGRMLSRLLYGIGASDPISVTVAASVLLTVAFLACYLPARWASRVDPLVALRE